MQAPKAEAAVGLAVTLPEAGVGRNEGGDLPLGAQLKVYFGQLTDGPVPDRLLRLTEQLEAAFERGEFRCGGARPR